MLKSNKAMGRINPRYHPSSTICLPFTAQLKSLLSDTRSPVRTAHEPWYLCSNNGEPSVSTYRPDSHPVFSQSAREWTSQEIPSSTGSQSMACRSCL